MKNRNIKRITVLSISVLVIVGIIVFVLYKNKQQEADDILSLNVALLVDNDPFANIKLAANDTLIRFDTPMINIGILKIGEEKSLSFKYKNTYVEPIALTNVVVSCGCTSVEWSKEPLMPGNERGIDVVYQAKQKAVVFEKILVYCDKSSIPIEIAIVGEVKDDK